jgi:hypothetical protein
MQQQLLLILELLVLLLQIILVNMEFILPLVVRLLMVLLFRLSTHSLKKSGKHKQVLEMLVL